MPKIIIVYNNLIYILDKSNYNVFIIKDEQVVKKFGRKGEGPGEFRSPVSMGVFSNKVWISNLTGELVFYSLNGNYIKNNNEILKKFEHNAMIKILGENKILYSKVLPYKKFAAMLIKYILKDKQKEIELTRSKIPISKSFYQELNFSKMSIPTLAVGANYLFLSKNKYLYSIDVYNLNSKKYVNKIEDKGYKNIKFDQEERNKMHHLIKDLLKAFPNTKRSDFKFCSYFPAIERIYADESDNLYVLTHETKNNKMLLNQYNNKLKLINKLYVPKTIKPSMLKIQKNKIYLKNEINDNYYLEIYVF